MTQPVLFISHGAPSLLLDEQQPAHRFLRELGESLPRPAAVLCVSAHWETRLPMLTHAPRHETIHDFQGFADELYDFHYQPPGDPSLADTTANTLREAGYEIGVHPSRGLDHGAWVPLALMWPDADIPVVQLSVQPHESAEYHWHMGEQLRNLRSQDVLILGSGSATHDLRGFHKHPVDAPAEDYARRFDDWLHDAVSRHDADAIRAYLHEAPLALHNHPTAEHFLPLVVAMAAGGEPGRQLHAGFTYGTLSMAAYRWH